jgi:hypothetical protein
VVGVFADNRTQAEGFEKLVLAFAQVQHDLGAVALAPDAFQGVAAAAVGLPVHALVFRRAGLAGSQHDLLRNHEGGVEADTELADEPSVFLVLSGQGVEELAGTGAGDGPDIRHYLVAVHADAIVVDGDGTRLLVHGYPDLALVLVLDQRLVGQRLEAQPVDGIRGIGDQFAQEDLALAVERMDHQVQDLLHLGLESEGLARRGRGGVRVGHDRSGLPGSDSGPAGPMVRGSAGPAPRFQGPGQDSDCPGWSSPAPERGCAGGIVPVTPGPGIPFRAVNGHPVFPNSAHRKRVTPPADWPLWLDCPLDRAPVVPARRRAKPQAADRGRERGV